MPRHSRRASFFDRASAMFGNLIGESATRHGDGAPGPHSRSGSASSAELDGLGSPPIAPARMGVHHMRNRSRSRSHDGANSVASCGSAADDVGGPSGSGINLQTGPTEGQRGRVFSVGMVMVLHTVAMRLVRGDLVPAGPSPSTPPVLVVPEDTAAVGHEADAHDDDGAPSAPNTQDAGVVTPAAPGHPTLDAERLFALQHSILDRIASLFESHGANAAALEVCGSGGSGGGGGLLPPRRWWSVVEGGKKQQLTNGCPANHMFVVVGLVERSPGIFWMGLCTSFLRAVNS